MKRATDYSKKTKEDLLKKVAEFRSRLQELNFKLVANQVKGVREVRATKKEIARLHTALKTK